MKKLLSIVLAVVMVIGLASVSFAAEDKIVGAIKPIDTNATYNYDSVVPGTKMVFPLTADMFEWSSGKAGGANVPISNRDVSRSSMRVVISGTSSGIVKNVSIKQARSSVTNNQSTAVVELEFVEPFVSTSTKKFDFSLFITLNYRQPDSRVRLIGYIENKVVPASSYDDYVNLSGGAVLDPTETVRNLEMDLGNSIFLTTNVFSGRKYYAYSSATIIPEDDNVLSKYPSISDILRLQQINLKKAGKYINLDMYDGYVYSSSGSFLGRTSQLVEYSDIYYISSKDLGNSISTGGTSSGSDTTSSGGFTSSTPSTSSGGTSSGTVTPPKDKTVTVTQATQAANTAVKSAQGKGSKVAAIRSKNDTAITVEALNAMANVASKAGMTAQYTADTIEGRVVVGRITANPANLAKGRTSDLKLGAHIGTAQAKKTKAAFEKSFKNKIAVVSFDENGTFNTPVQVAAKVDLTGFNKSNIFFYSYNRATNKYYLIQKPNAWIDTNGYVRFTTTLAGDIVISEGALTK